MCTHVVHFIKIKPYFFSFFQFWQKKFGKTPHFCKFFEVGGAFAFLSEKMGNYNYKTYFKQYLDSLRHEKRNFSRHNETKVL